MRACNPPPTIRGIIRGRAWLRQFNRASTPDPGYKGCNCREDELPLGIDKNTLPGKAVAHCSNRLRRQWNHADDLLQRKCA